MTSAAEQKQEKSQQAARVLAAIDSPEDPAAEAPLAPDIPPDRTRQFRSVNFSRMRTKWGEEDRAAMDHIQFEARRIMEASFPVALDLLERLWMCVRIPLTDEDGNVIPGPNGRPRWESHPNGTPVEDWTLLTDRERANFIFEITTHLAEWRQQAVMLWTEAMYAKGDWEQAFAHGYIDAQGTKLTIDDRTQRGHLAGVERRYFAIYQSALSRHADALVRSLEKVAEVLQNTKF